MKILKPFAMKLKTTTQLSSKLDRVGISSMSKLLVLFKFYFQFRNDGEKNTYSNKVDLSFYGIKSFGFFRVFFFLITIVLGLNGNAATYFSKSGTAPNLAASWNTNRDGTSGTAPSNFTSGDIFVIQGSASAPGGTAHSLTTTAIWSISGTSSKLWIEGGATLTASHQITLAAATTFQIDASGKYIHNNSTTSTSTTTFAGTESFAATSTIEFQNFEITNGSSTTAFEVCLNASTTNFGNVIWNIQTGTTAYELRVTGSTTKTISGNFTITKTGASGSLTMANKGTVGKFTISGDFSLSGGTFRLIGTGVGASGAILEVLGNFSISGGTFDVGSAVSYNSNLYLSGDFSMTGGAFTNSAPNTSNAVYFTKSGTQTFTQSSGTFTTTSTPFTVNSGSYLKLASNFSVGRSLTVLSGGSLDIPNPYYTTGTGSTILNSGSKLYIGHASGIYSSTATGAVQTTTRTFSNTYFEYNGTAAQVTGSALPTNSAITLVINNSEAITSSSTGVSLSASVSFPATGSPNLSLTTGILTTGSYSMGISSTSTITGGSSLSYVNGYLTIQRGSGSLGVATYPIGKAGRYLPVEFTAITHSSGSTIGLEAFNANCGGTISSNGFCYLSSTEYWKMTFVANAPSNISAIFTRNTALGDLNIITSTALSGTYNAAASYSSLGAAATYPTAYSIKNSTVFAGNTPSPQYITFAFGSSLPNPGTATATLSSVCSGSSTTVSVSGYSAGATIQWQESDDNGGSDAWATVVGGLNGTTATYTTANLTSIKYYRAAITGGPSGCSGTSYTASTSVSVTAANTAGAASSSPTLCINTVLTNITHTTTSATGISNSGVSGGNSLPTGVSASWSGNVITISGTPSVSGTFNYSIPLTGGCGSVNATGTITINSSPTISSQPINSSILQGNSTTFSVGTSASSPTYQWQYSANGSTGWASVADATPSGFTYSGSTGSTLTVSTSSSAPAVVYYYRCVVTSNGCSTNSSNGYITLTGYCTPAMTTASASGDYIGNFTFAGINNTTGDAATDYTFYSSLTADVTAGSGYAVSFMAGGSSTTYAQQFGVWIDYNQNGVFTDANEFVFNTTSSTYNPTVSSGTINIPALSSSVLQGTTRLRVGSRYNTAVASTNSCLGGSTYGEYEDYNITISAPALPTITSFTPSSGCASTGTITITGTNLSGATVVSIGGTAAIVTVNTSTSITATVGNGTTGTVSVTTAGGTVTSSSTFTVNTTPAAPSASAQSFCSSSSYTVANLQATGSSIQWYAASSGGSALGGSTVLVNSTTYYATQTVGSCESTSRTSAVVTITTPIAITASPSTTPVSTCINGTAFSALSVTATGTSPSYQWYSNTTSSTSGGTTVGTNSNSYTPVNTSAGTLYYYCIVSSGTPCSSSVTSSVSGAVTVYALPANPSNPTSDSPQCASPGVTLTSSGSAPVGETWYWQTTTTGTSTSSSASTYNATTAGTYYIRSKNTTSGCWSSGYGSATISINSVPATVTLSSPSNASSGISLTPTLTWAAVSGATSYDVYIGTTIPGTPTANVSTNSYSPSTLLGSTGYTWKVVANNACGSGTASSTRTFTTLIANDACADATSISCATSDLAGTTIGAVSETAPTSVSGYGVWYKFTGDGSSVTLSSFSADFDLAISLFSGTCGSLTLISSTDNYSALYSEDYTFTSVNSTSYYVYISHYSSYGTSSNVGDFVISMSTAPASPSSITGSTSICESSTGNTYSVTNVSGNTYNWTLPSGWSKTAGGTSNSITVTGGSSSGTISVTATNTCGTSTASSLAVTIIALPTATATNGGPYCAGNSIQLTGGGAGYATYAWSGPNSYAASGSAATGISENFDGTLTGWSLSGVTSGTGQNCSGANALQFSGLSQYAITPAITNPNILNCNIKRSTNTTAWSVDVQISSASPISQTSGPWTTVTTIGSSVSNTCAAITAIDLSSYTGIRYIRFIDTRVSGAHARGIDDVVITASASGLSPTISSATPSMSGVYTLTTTNSGCSTTATTTVTVNNPTASAGAALSAICQSGISEAMGGSTGGSATGGTWSGGAGTWTNATNPSTATYTASASETGSITLTLTTSGGSCSATTATKTITVNANPTASAGAALSAICQSGVSAAMGGSTGGGATGGTWSGGVGSWTNASNASTATYTAGASETGSITLTLTTSGGSCSTTTTTKTITVNANPTATAGSALSAICQSGVSAAMGGSTGGGATGGTWSGGAGTWTNASNASTATYTAGASETGSITLTLTTSGGSCSTTTATKTITVNANPTASAGAALSAICQSGVSAAMGGSTGGGATGGTWSGGAGTWTNASNASTATYTAGASETGSITLTLTTSGGSCSTTTATKTITVNANPTASAGAALSAICQSGVSAAMGGSTGGSATGGTWTGGAGTWSNATNASTATYTAGASETGSITLTLTTSGGSCSTTTATKTITVNANPTASAGAALSAICQSGISAAMGGSTGGSATGGTWTGGAGTWSNATDASTATYTASASETGSITLTLTTSGGSCSTTTATKTITVNANPTISSTTAGSRCDAGTVSLGAAASTGTINWYAAASGGASLGTGTSFTTSSISSNTTYYVDATANGCTTGSRSSVLATVNTTPTISSTTAGSRCGNGTVNLGAAASAGTINWYAASSGGASLGTGTSFTTSSISSNTTYYVDATANGCTTGARSSVLATVNNPMTTTPVNGDVIWVGSSTAWGTLGNWLTYNGTSYSTPLAAPSASNRVVISSANSCASAQPTLTANTSIGDLIIESGATLNQASYTLTVGGSFTNNGTFTNGSGTTIFNGASAQTISGTSNTTFNNLTLNNSSGLTVSKGITINGILTFTAGNIFAASSSEAVTFETSGTASGAADTRCIVGYCKKNTNSTTKFIFPVGTSTLYRSAAITPSGTSATTWTAKYFGAGYGSYAVTGGSIYQPSKQEYWTIDRSGASNATVELSWGSNSHVYAPNATDLIVAHFTGTAWENAGGNNISGSATGVVSSNANWSSYSPFTLGSQQNGVTLPITLVSFEAKPYQKDVKVSWQTASEIENDYFTVERSVNGKDFSDIARVDGAGNSSHTINYFTMDTDFNRTILYYRLKLTSFNGEETYSNIASVDMSQTQNQGVIIMTVNSLGQEVNESAKGIVFDIYSDGTSVKRIQF